MFLRVGLLRLLPPGYIESAMTGRRIRLYISHDQDARIPPGNKEAPYDLHVNLIKLSKKVKNDYYEVVWMPKSILLRRYFSAYVCYLGGLQVPGYATFVPPAKKQQKRRTKIKIEQIGEELDGTEPSVKLYHVDAMPEFMKEKK